MAYVIEAAENFTGVVIRRVHDISVNYLGTESNEILRDGNVTSTFFTFITDLPVGRCHVMVRGIAAEGIRHMKHSAT